MPTQDNLQAAFAGESQANRKYLAFAAKAEAEGSPKSPNCSVPPPPPKPSTLSAHFRVMKGVGDTKQNLQAAIDGEEHEFKEMYPAFIEIAEKEGKSGGGGLLPQRQRRREDALRSVLQGPGNLNAGKDLSPAPSMFAMSAATRRSGRLPTSAPSAVHQVEVQGSGVDRLGREGRSLLDTALR